MVQGQPRQIVCELLSQKYPTQKKGWLSGLKWESICVASIEALSSNSGTAKKKKKKILGLGVVAHTCHPSFSGGEERIAVPGQLGQKHKTVSEKTN
jgi:hypothetical protein